MTAGQKTYEALIKADESARDLWSAAKEAGMDHGHIELIRNYTGTLKRLRELWDAERARWEETPDD